VKTEIVRQKRLYSIYYWYWIE